MHDVAVGLDRHQLVDGDAPVLADPAEVVAAEVDEHHVLGTLLVIAEQLGGDLPVLFRAGTSRARAGDRLR